jgi:hypothetical protein
MEGVAEVAAARGAGAVVDLAVAVAVAAVMVAVTVAAAAAVATVATAAATAAAIMDRGIPVIQRPPGAMAPMPKPGMTMAFIALAK